MKTIAAHTLGCKVNQYDTQAMLELFLKEGYQSVSVDEPADVYLINTCTVTGTGDKADVLQHRAVRLRIVEGHIPEFQRGKGADIVLVGAVVLNGGGVIQNGVDTGHGGHGPGNHVHHHGRRHDTHEDVHQVGDEGGEGTDLHAAGVDADGAHIVGGQGGHIHDQAHHGHQSHHQSLRLEADAEHLHIGLVVALFLVFRPDKGPNDPDAGELFPHDLVQKIHLSLAALEPGMGFPGDKQDCRGDDRYDDHQDQAELRVLLDAHDDSADQQNGRSDDGTQEHLHHYLKLVDVVGGSGDQRGGPEFVQIRLGKGLNLGEQRQPHVPAIGQGGPGGAIGGTQGADAHHQGHHQHDPAAGDNDGNIALHDALVDDGGVEVRQEQITEALGHNEYNGQDHPPLIWSHVLEKILQCVSLLTRVPCVRSGYPEDLLPVCSGQRA